MLSRRFLRPLLSTSCGRRSWWPQATPSYPFFLGTTSITPKVPSASLFSFFSSNATTSTSTEPHPLHTSNHPTTSSSSTSKSNPDTDSTNPSSNHGSVNEQIQQLQSELKEKSDKLTSVLSNYHRALADAENLRARTKKEIEQAHLYSLQSMMKDLLTTLDTLGLAIASVANEKETLLKNPALKNVYDGLVMTQEAFLSTLHHYGVRRMDVVEGDVFQPHQHHALFEVPKLDAVPGTVVQVMKTGYWLHDRVLRPAQVGVVKESDVTTSSEQEKKETDLDPQATTEIKN